MASVSSISSANRYGFEQLRLQQARRNADQAEQTAQALKIQADQAQREAVQANENARSLSNQSSQARANAGQARQGLAAMSSAQQSVSQLSRVVDQVVARQPAAIAVTERKSAGTPTPSVVNSQGQVTGKIINTTA